MATPACNEVSDVKDLVIESGAQNSTIVDLNRYSTGSIQFPAAMDGTNVQVQVSIDETNWTNFGTAITFSANNTEPLPDGLVKFTSMRLLSQASETAERTIKCVLKHLVG